MKLNLVTDLDFVRRFKDKERMKGNEVNLQQKNGLTVFFKKMLKIAFFS